MNDLRFSSCLIIVLLAGGGLTSLLIATGGQRAADPSAGRRAGCFADDMLPWKANQFFILMAFAPVQPGRHGGDDCDCPLADRLGLKRSKAEASEAQNQTS